MNNCEKVKELKTEFDTLKKEKTEKLNLQLFVIKLINFAQNTVVGKDVEPYLKIKKLYDDDRINYEYKQTIPLIEIYLNQLVEKFCEKRQQPRFKVL